ncbi:Zn(II)2Cys6 transcription factor [Aspergillus mulundensis]|uniref:Zn(2)-C6 fungal-type domain-containing protein n=1 Tax=Aspergillus mulundensis TaxID=1810919 RepID=A0A3D8S695_9EURO|nr:hypothetical protein DSM5745_05287 [Aspergillus mulundensis]RDW81730.1 hypothetical protein DSM5745_05287 [Aspergillus mulundensis]
MVGVPGRSKACVTCLKRKKRCDLEKPFCGTCRKARVECGGYHRPRIFINNTIENQSQLVLRKIKGTSARTDREDSHASSFTSKGSDVALLPGLARSAYQARYMDLFWRIYLPNGEALSVEVTQIALGKWIDAILDLNGSEPALRKALLAMSLATVGKQENNRYLKEEGRRLYTSSLQGMAVALKDPRRATSDAILTAVRLSSFFESCFGQNDGEVTQVRSWQAHNAGDIALISARSPYSFISGHAHDLFADGRSNLVSCLQRPSTSADINNAGNALPSPKEEMLLGRPRLEDNTLAPARQKPQRLPHGHPARPDWPVRRTRQYESSPRV